MAEGLDSMFSVNKNTSENEDIENPTQIQQAQIPTITIIIHSLLFNITIINAWRLPLTITKACVKCHQ